ncbi:hypothetical protein QYM36_016180 [Artemia franciscana]|uniref:HOOK N-terminal domain-containing protein n=1 Tax=Artemia franciscana TaxID=6661 RepID=A0AA88HBQ1_ARTSF|nr:hypothetical protein QYM36_016180 [Artemia franciscana]
MASVDEPLAVTEFMNSALVCWLNSFSKNGKSEKELDYLDLANGPFLEEVLNQIDSRTFSFKSCPVVDVYSRIRNLDLIVRSLKTFYEEILGQLIVVRLPDPVIVAKDPISEKAIADIELLLLLILGCAVQGPRKESVISDITKLPVDTQHSIVECIQHVTDNPRSIWCSEWSSPSKIEPEQKDALYVILVDHVKRLVKERDDYASQVVQLVLQEVSTDVKTPSSVSSTSSSVSDRHHTAVELADLKAKLRRFRQELEEKVEALSECKDDLEATKQALAKAKQENLELIQDARAGKAYRDELDIVRERASKVDRLEIELQRYRDKVNDIDFYKARVEELREDNRILEETKEMLETQLENSRKRVEQLSELEGDILKYKTQINNLVLERDAEREKIHELMEENAHLTLFSKMSLTESAQMTEVDILKIKSDSGNTSLSEQLSNDTLAKLRRLELENQKLVAAIENLKEEAFRESSSKILELEKENKRLSLKVNQFLESSQKEKLRISEYEVQLEDCKAQIKKLEAIVETLNASKDRIVEEFQTEKAQLEETVETLRERQHKTNNDRLREVEAENKSLASTSHQLQSQISRIEFEKQQLSKQFEKLKASNENLLEVENQKQKIEDENKGLRLSLESIKEFQQKFQILEAEHSDLLIEHKRLLKIADNLKSNCSKMDSLQQENMKMSGETQRLSRTIDNLKLNASRLAEAETEKDDLRRSQQLLKSQLEAAKLDRAKLEELETTNSSLSLDNQKYQRTIENLQRKLEDIEREVRETEQENQKLNKTVETLKSSTRRLNDLEKETTDLEAENHRLDRENKSLVKEVNRLKNSLEIKENSIDELTMRMSTLERENKRFQKDHELQQSQISRLVEIEQEHREFMQSQAVEKKTLKTLREDLVQEKLKRQHLASELDILTANLERIGLNKEKLNNVSALQWNGDTSNAEQERYKALESMLEGVLKGSLEAKEQRIVALEARLEESSNRNSELRNELKLVKKDYEALKQRHKEVQKEAESDNALENNAVCLPSGMKEVLELKDHLIDLERQNAVLEIENQNLRSNATTHKEESGLLQSQISILQSQLNSVQSYVEEYKSQKSDLQSLNAQLQVENTTLLSKADSLATQNGQLQSLSTQYEREKLQLSRQQEELQSRLEQMVNDQEQLQRLHEQLAGEYEQLAAEKETLKNGHKEAKLECKTLQDKITELTSGQEELTRIRTSLDNEKERLQSDARSLANLRAEHSRLKDDFRTLFLANERMKTEYKGLQVEYKSLKQDNNSLKLKQTEMQGDLSDCRDQITSLGVELSKLSGKCDVLTQLNAALEEDRRSLMSQVSLLLAQYHDLLTQTLEDRDHYHTEEKSFTDKLNHLMRQKEKLEEKIMDQYKRMDNNCSKNTAGGTRSFERGFGSNLVRKMRKASTDLINRVPRSRSRNRDGTEPLDGNDNSSISSGSGSASLDSGSEKRSSPQDMMNGDTHALLEEDENENHKTPPGALFRRSMPIISLSSLETNFKNSHSSDTLNNFHSLDSNEIQVGEEAANMQIKNSRLSLDSSNSAHQSFDRNSSFSALNAGSRRPLVLGAESSGNDPINNDKGGDETSAGCRGDESFKVEACQDDRSICGVTRTNRPSGVVAPILTPTNRVAPLLRTDVGGSANRISSTPINVSSPVTTPQPRGTPSLVNTTHINVSIEERSNEPRLPPPPRPFPRTGIDSTSGRSLPSDSIIPPLPSRSAQNRRSTIPSTPPQIPPRSNTEPPATNESTSGVTSSERNDVNSIWYEYGCV